MSHGLNSKFLFISSIVILFTGISFAQPTKNVRLIFMEPDAPAVNDEMPVYRIVTDTNRLTKYTKWIDNEPAQWAIRLYGEAKDVMDTAGHVDIPTYYIALVEGGNNAAIGFSLHDNSGINSYPDVPYIKLAPEDWVITTTFLHETGHVVLYILNGRKEIPKREIASIPHSTAALTDRGTAFDEGFAIHLETLAARFSSDPIVRERYHHDRYLFGTSDIHSEYDRQVADLLTYSQSRARYQDVAENSFAFCSAFKGPDYFRVQLEKSRDYSSVRSPDQLLQSEGFYASFFYSFLLRGTATLDTVNQRQERMLRALAFMFGSHQIDSESPFLLYFVQSYMKLYPEEASEAVEVLLELSHGVFIDPQGATMWRNHYIGALRLDMAERSNKKIQNSLNGWRTEVMNDSNVLYSRLGPQIRCMVPEDSLMLVAFGENSVLSFDVNTVEEGIIRIIPDITDQEVDSWLMERDKRPYVDAADFKNRSGLSKGTLEQLKF